MLLLGVGAFSACSDDLDNNPVLKTPETFTLNTPAYANQNTDLATSSSLTFTWSQPDYGFPAAAEYQLQASLDGKFTVSVDEAAADETGKTKANYLTFDNVFTLVEGSINAEDFNKGIMKIGQWEEDAMPESQTVYVRAMSTYGGSTIYSNTVAIKVLPYFVELSDASVEIWWLIGGDIADGSWGTDIGKSVIPMQPIEGEEYDAKGQGKIQWIGYLKGDGFKLRGDLNDGWATQWGQGDSFGTFVKNDGGSANITVPEAGYYKVTLNTATDELTVEPYVEAVETIDGISISGSFNEWGDEEMTPCAEGENNHDWFIEYTFEANAEVKFKQTGTWDYNKGGELISADGGNLLYGFGVSNGANLIMPEPATYIVVFNDITGMFHFYKK